MSSDDVIDALRDKSLLWSIGFVNAADVVRAACDVVAAGHGGMAMAMLAGVHFRRADEEAPELMPDALAEVSLPFYPRGSEDGQMAGLAAMAGRVISGVLKPRELTAWAHGVIGHDGCELGQPLVALDDVYDAIYATAEHYGRPVDTSDWNAEVVEEARRLIDGTLSRSASPTSD